MKATYLYNFALFTEWPVTQSEESFNLCIYGRDNFGSSLRNIEGRVIKGKRLSIARLNSLSLIRHCQILYITDRETAIVRQAWREVADAPVMIITESPQPTAATINLYLVEDRLAFDINNQRAKNAGLAISSKVMQLSRPMNSPSVTDKP